MSYDIQKTLAGRRPMRRVSVNFKRCGLEYGKSYTNLLLYSRQLDNPAWVKVNATVLADAIDAPDGQKYADKLVETTSTSSHLASQLYAMSAGTPYTFSIYLKAGGRSVVTLLLYSATELYRSAHFDLLRGTVKEGRNTLTGGQWIEYVGDGWYKCWVYGITSATPASSYVSLRMSDIGSPPAGGASYTGDGVSGVYMGGAQLVLGNKPGHYVGTTSSSASFACAATNAKANLLRYSEQLGNTSAWVLSFISVVNNAALDSEGLLAMDRIVASTGVNYHNIAQTITLDANSVYCYEVELKAADSNWDWAILYVHRKDGTYVTCTVDLTNGSIYATGSIIGQAEMIHLGNSIYLVRFYFDSLSGATSTTYHIEPLPTGGARPVAGDGVSGPYAGRARIYKSNKPAIYYKTEATAFNGTIGTECFNTRKTCQSVASFIRYGYFVARVCEETVEPQFDLGAIPCIKEIGTAHTEIAPGQDSIGKRAGIGIKCTDFPYHDRGFDPYLDGRTYTPMQQGTFFGKLKARNPYYQNALVTVETGYLTDPFDLANFKTKTYFLEKFEGPDKSGQVLFVAQDIMRRLDDERCTCPEVTVGKLTAALAAGTTSSFTVSGDADKYDTSNGSVSINDEVILYTTGTNNGDGTFTFSTLTRGADGTTADDHSLNDAVQKCAFFDSMLPRDIAYTLYNTYAGIPSNYLNTTQWDSIADTWLQVPYTRRVTKPTSVKQLMGEAHQQMGFVTWWDEENASIKLEAIRPPDYGSIATYSEGTHFDSRSLEVKEKTDLRVTQVHFYYLYKNPVEGDKPEHFRRRIRVIDAGAESNDQHGDSRIKEIFANWVRSDNTAASTAGRHVNRFRDNIRMALFNLDAKDENLNTGDQCYLEHSAIQDASGAAKPTLFQIVQRDEIESGHKYDYRAWELFFYGRYARIAPAGMPNYGSATDEQKEQYSWISAAGGADFSDGGSAYKIV